MAECRFARLGHRAVLRVDGEDRQSFLQGLISNDIAKAGPGRAMWAAFLTPQGKFLNDLFITETGGAFLIDVEAARAEEFRKKLGLYKLRSRVGITPAGGMAVWAAWGGGASTALGVPDEAGAAVPFAGGMAYVDPRLAAAGLRLMLPEAEGAAALAAAGLAEDSADAWDGVRMGLGLPDGSRDLPLEKAILLENGFDELGGIDFTKGCYMGQELTSRTKYRGLVRKRLMPVEIDGPAPEPGSPVMLGDADAGEMRSSAGKTGLALIRLDAWRKAGGERGAFVCGAARLSPAKPDWAVFPEPE